MERKVILAFLLVSCMSFVLSLECYECQSSNKPCEAPMTKMCAEDEKCCVSLLYKGTYGRGCTSNKDICKTKSSNGEGFDKCYTCETDLCNDS
ncbi:hypothetical protein WA026_007830 [Henosepilachna vigintioctopunctata]|uniref:Uncharacterized protein n=1 Tax=Henosepilachna vigintioctopunctata TaxID=420089 RepID=A0AAW1U5N2_9CUCU